MSTRNVSISIFTALLLLAGVTLVTAGFAGDTTPPVAAPACDAEQLGVLEDQVVEARGDWAEALSLEAHQAYDLARSDFVAYARTCAPALGADLTTLVASVVNYSAPADAALEVRTAPLVPAAPSQTEADLKITKRATPDPVVAGETLTYTLIITNSGPYTATNTVVTDNVPEGLSGISYSASSGGCNAGVPGVRPTICNLGPVPAGGSETVTIRASVDPDVADGTILPNSAQVRSETHDPDTSYNIATIATTVDTEADLRLVKSAVGTPVAGQIIHYEYQVSNLGPSVSRDVTLRDFLPAEVEFVDAFVDAEGGTGGVPLTTCTVTLGSNALFCPLGDIPPTGSVPILVFVNVRIKADVPANTAITNSADILLTDTTDPDSSNNSDDATSTVQTRADLAITKTSEPQKVEPGDRKRYDITVTNLGPSNALTVTVTDTLPSGLTYETNDLGYCALTSTDPDVLVCSLGTVAADEVRQFSIWVLVDQGTAGDLINTAEVSGISSLGDPNPANNVAIAQNLALATPTATPTPDVDSIEGWVWIDSNADGVHQAAETGGLFSVTINLYIGVTLVDSKATVPGTYGGWYGFVGLIPGTTYKVEEEQPAGYTSTTPNELTIPFAGGRDINNDFGEKQSTPTPTATATDTPTATPTDAPTATPTPTATSSPTATATVGQPISPSVFLPMIVTS